MRPEELMVGDLVTFKDCQNDKHPTVVKIMQINVNGNALVSIDGDKAYDEINIDDEVVGIPLTKNILRKSGFKKATSNKDDEDYNKYYNIKGQCYGFWQQPNNILIIPASALGWIDLQYIHELQHVLRLCNIYKEIKL